MRVHPDPWPVGTLRRVVVMGPPGSGKSTLARRLGVLLGVPVFHLDQAYFRPGWVQVSPDVFAAEVARLAALPGWVMDGNYTDTVGPRFAAADAVIYLDIPPWLSVLRVLRRTLLHYGRVRPDAAVGCAERFDLGFLSFAWTFGRVRRPRNLRLVAGFAGRWAVVANVGQAEALVAAARA